MFTICSLYVHYMFTICSLYVHYMFTICSLYVCYMFTKCSRYVHCIFNICSLKVKVTVYLGYVSRDRICSDPFGIGSTLVVYSVCMGPVLNWNGMVPQRITFVRDPFGTRQQIQLPVPPGLV